MAFKLSILGFTAIAFVGPILLFVSALLVYRRVRWQKKQLALHDIGLNDNGWHELLKQKSDPSKLSSINLADVPLVVVEGKRSSSRLGSGVLAVGSPASTTSGGATTTTSNSNSNSSSNSSSSSRPGSSEVSPQHSLRGSSLLTPPPAAVHLPDTQPQPQPAQPQPQQGDGHDQQASAAQQTPPGGDQAHCVLQMPPSDAAQAPAAAAPAPSMLQGAAGYVAAMLTAHTYALGRAALGGTAGSGGAAPQQQAVRPRAWQSGGWAAHGLGFVGAVPGRQHYC